MTAINKVTDLTIEDGIAVLTINSPPVNALSAPVRDGMTEGFKQALADPAAKAIVLICEGRTFIAGADITEFGGEQKGASLLDVQVGMENATKPVIAAIHGTALGGGLEMALCAHYRVCVPSAKCGLPEVNLGLLPGAGGTQRLPRIVGAEAALEMMTSGRHVPSKECLEYGLIDEVVPEGELRAGAIAFAKKLIAEKRPLKRVRDLNDKMERDRAHPEIFEKFRKANAQKFRGFLAPEYNIRCIEAAVNLPFDQGIEVERKLFGELITGSQSAAQRYIFFAERQVWKLPDVPADTPQIPIKKVGVIGAGTMGGGIAMNFLNAGLPVTIVETKQEALDRGLAVIRGNYENTAKKGRMSAADVETRMGLLTGSLKLEDLADCDMVTEAVFEDMNVKKDVFKKLDGIVKQGAVLASNTSFLDLNEIASVTKRPEAVIGMHYFSPANVMRLLEVVRGAKTSKEVIATAMGIAKKIGKIGALVGVCPGFVANRVMSHRSIAAQELVMEGAMPWDVDRVIYEFGFPMGPFQMIDLVGLDVIKSATPTMASTLCDMGRRGQKSGGGYYDYDANRNRTPSPAAEKIIAEFRAKAGITPRKISDAEILERSLYPVVNEGAKILEEGMAIRASDIDIICINGYAWPVYQGGPMFYGDLIGLDKVLAKMKQWHSEKGDQFKPAALLEKLVAEGKRFQDMK